MVFLSRVSWPSISLEGAECVVARKTPALFVGDDAGDAEVLEKGNGGAPSMLLWLWKGRRSYVAMAMAMENVSGCDLALLSGTSSMAGLVDGSGSPARRTFTVNFRVGIVG